MITTLNIFIKSVKMPRHLCPGHLDHPYFFRAVIPAMPSAMAIAIMLIRPII